MAWLIGLAISMWMLGAGLIRITSGQSARLDFRELAAKRHLMLGHHSLNLSVQLPRVLILVIVAIIVGPAANAAFTAAVLVVGFVNVIPVHLTTALFALAPGDEEALHREVLRTMQICLVVALVSAPFFIVFSHFILGLFGKDYQSATAAMVILGFTTYPVAIKAHFVSIARVRGRIQQAAYLTMIGACFEVGFEQFGLNGTGSRAQRLATAWHSYWRLSCSDRPCSACCATSDHPVIEFRKGPQADAVKLAVQNLASAAFNQSPPGDVPRNGVSGREELVERGSGRLTGPVDRSRRNLVLAVDTAPV